MNSRVHNSCIRNLIGSILQITSTKHITVQQNVQKKATKILPQYKNLKYEDRLRDCKLPTLHFRRFTEPRWYHCRKYVLSDPYVFDGI